MLLSPEPLAHLAHEHPLILPDRRRYKRYAVNLHGRYMRASKQELPCKLFDISAGGVAIETTEMVELGERIVAYFDHLGSLEGQVVRRFDGGFGMPIIASRSRREKLAAQITWLINRDVLSAQEMRAHDRTPVNKPMTLRLPDDMVVNVRVLDVSVTGASIATEHRPLLGQEVMLGRLRARVVRHHTEGIAVQFSDLQQIDSVRRTFG
jgi:PilZ domain